MQNSDNHTIIIGGGPAGASAAIYLARFNHSVTLLDAPEAVHGRTAMAPDINNFLGYPTPISGPAFMEKLQQQVAQYSIDRIEEKVIKLEHNGDVYIATTDRGTERRARYAIVAVGLSDNMPEIEGLDPYYDQAVFHCLTCDWYERRNKLIAIVANGDRGIDTALMLRHIYPPSNLCVIPAAEPNFSADKLAAAVVKNIAVYHSPLQELVGEDGYLHAVKLADGTQVDVEVLFTKLGHVRFDAFLDKGGVTVDRESSEGFIKVNWRTFETSVKNLFAVGPCNDGPDQIIISGGQGAMAALEIHSRIVDEFALK